MSDLQERAQTSVAGDDRSRKLRIAAIIGVVAVVAIGFAVWYFLIRDDSAASVTSDAAAEARNEALTGAGAGDPVAPDGGALGARDVAADGIEGTWTVDTTIGEFNDACLTEVCGSTFVGFRIDEELANIGAKTVVGRTPGVSGTMEIAGTTITAADLTVDMTQLITDSGNRTNAIRNQAIDTNAFPEARFTLTAPIDLGSVPADGEQIALDAVGDLTIHGVTRNETIPLTAELQGDVIVVFGELADILLADYDISEPSAAVVLSVEDHATMELQLFFT